MVSTMLFSLFTFETDCGHWDTGIWQREKHVKVEVSGGSHKRGCREVREH